MINPKKNLFGSKVPLQKDMAETELDGGYAKVPRLQKTSSSEDYTSSKRTKKNRHSEFSNTVAIKENIPDSYFQKRILQRLQVFQKEKVKYPNKESQENN